MSMLALVKGLTDAGRRVASILHGLAETRTTSESSFNRARSALGNVIDLREHPKDWKLAQDTVKQWTRMRNVPKDSRIVSGYVETDSVQTRRYRTTVTLQVRRPDTGETFFQRRVLQHDDLRVRREIEDDAFDSLTKEVKYDLELISAMPVMGFIRKLPGE